MTPRRLLQREPFCFIAALVAGAASTFAFAPFHWWPIAIISAAILLTLLTGTTARKAFFRGWAYGFGFFLAAVSWVYISIHEFGSASIAVACILTIGFAAGLALFFGLHGLVFQRLVHALQLTHSNTIQNTVVIILTFPSLWVIAEWFRSWFLTGFPWALLGYAPMDTWLAGWAPITGVYGLSFFCALAAAGLVLITQQKSRRLQLGLAVCCFIPFLSGLWLQDRVFTQTKGNPISTVLIQGNTPQQVKWNPDYRQRIYDKHISLTLENLDNSLVVWPETAIPELLNDAQPRLNAISEFLNERGIALLTGIPTQTTPSNGRKRYHNSVIGLGTASGIYHKQRLVPFGEYVPLESMLRGLIAFFDLPMSSFSLGPEHQLPIQLQNDITIAPYICYEIVYPDLVASETGNILLTASNDSWFGDSLAPHQHLQMARMRALESSRFLLRATNNGISAIIDERGKIVQQAPQFVATTLVGKVQAMQGETPYMKTGSWPILIISLLLIATATVTTRTFTRQD